MDSIEIKQTVELIQKIINTDEYVILKKEDDIKYRNKLIQI